MLQNIIVGIIVVFAIVFLIKHFMKGRCSCGCCSSKKSCRACDVKKGN